MSFKNISDINWLVNHIDNLKGTSDPKVPETKVNLILSEIHDNTIENFNSIEELQTEVDLLSEISFYSLSDSPAINSSSSLKFLITNSSGELEFIEISPYVDYDLYGYSSGGNISIGVDEQVITIPTTPDSIFVFHQYSGQTTSGYGKALHKYSAQQDIYENLSDSPIRTARVPFSKDGSKTYFYRGLGVFSWDNLEMYTAHMFYICYDSSVNIWTTLTNLSGYGDSILFFGETYQGYSLDFGGKHYSSGSSNYNGSVKCYKRYNISHVINNLSDLSQPLEQPFTSLYSTYLFYLFGWGFSGISTITRNFNSQYFNTNTETHVNINTYSMTSLGPAAEIIQSDMYCFGSFVTGFSSYVYTDNIVKFNVLESSYTLCGTIPITTPFGEISSIKDPVNQGIYIVGGIQSSTLLDNTILYKNGSFTSKTDLPLTVCSTALF